MVSMTLESTTLEVTDAAAVRGERERRAADKSDRTPLRVVDRHRGVRRPQASDAV